MWEPKFLTFAEVCLKLRCGHSALETLIEKRVVYAIKIPMRRTQFRWMILWPPDDVLPYIKRMATPVDHAPLLNLPETAEILGITQTSLRTYCRRGYITPAEKKGKYVYFSVEQVRKYLYARERRKRLTKTPTIQRMVDWFKSTQAGNYSEKDPVDEALKEILLLPEQEREAELKKLYDKIDRAEQLFNVGIMTLRP